VPIPALPGALPPTANTPRAESPLPGQHSKAILAEHGFTPREIAALLADGAVAASS
jgi:crotonobetainyl-CoA:carnitine CoA-transferase CaiB-like acyl-CoA transferase